MFAAGQGFWPVFARISKIPGRSFVKDGSRRRDGSDGMQERMIDDICSPGVLGGGEAGAIWKRNVHPVRAASD